MRIRASCFSGTWSRCSARRAPRIKSTWSVTHAPFPPTRHASSHCLETELRMHPDALFLQVKFMLDNGLDPKTAPLLDTLHNIVTQVRRPPPRQALETWTEPDHQTS